MPSLCKPSRAMYLSHHVTHSLFLLLFQLCSDNPWLSFPGRDQEEQFSKFLQQILAHEAKVNELAYPLQHLGTHIICKGAVLCLLSVPGGLQAAAVCICVG